MIKYLSLSLLGLLLFFTPACTKEEVKIDSSRGAGVDNDPCGARLHDMAGHLLYYYAKYKRLPETLDGLIVSPIGKIPPARCPVSNKPYVYTSYGLHLPDQDLMLLMYDPLPTHSGMRWAIVTKPPSPGRPIVPKAMLLTDDIVLKAQKIGKQRAGMDKSTRE